MSAVLGTVIGLVLAGGATALFLEHKKRTSIQPPIQTPQNTQFDLIDTKTGQTINKLILSNLDLITLVDNLPSRFQIINQVSTNNSTNVTIPDIFLIIPISEELQDSNNQRNTIEEFVVLSSLV